MTNRDFYTAVMNGDTSETIKAFAKSELAKMDERNEKRRNTQSKTQKENEPIKQAILDFLSNGANVASEIGKAIGQSTSKVSSLCTQLKSEGKITSTEVKSGKSKVQQYALAE